MGIEDGVVTCCVCEKEKLFREIRRAEINKGKMIYTCKDCILNDKDFII